MSVQVSEKHKAVVIPADVRIPNLFPHHKTLPTGQHVLPHGPEEVRVLRNLGYAVPSPVMTDYDWGGTKPFKAQIVTTAMLVVEPRAYVLNTMGTGKTRSVLFAYDFLKRRGLVNKMLVAAPLSTLNFTWAREVFGVFPKYSVGILHGTKEKRQRVLAEDHDIYVVNHDGLVVLNDDIKAKFGDDDVFCIDEVAVFRNHRAKKHKSAAKLVNKFKYVWGLTGTPTPREPTNAFGIMKLINPPGVNVPKIFTHFRDELMIQHGQFKWTARPGAQEKVYKYMQPSVRFTLEDCIDMPPIVHQDYEADMSSQQKKIYKAVLKHCRAMSQTGNITAVNEGVAINKLIQIATGCVFLDGGASERLDAKKRMDVLRELIEENDHSVIVFAPYVPLVDALVDEMGSLGVTVHKVYGATSQKERDRIFNTFQNSPTKQVIIAHPATMSHGLTLTAANLIVWYGPTYDLEVYLQANARIARPGQTADRIVIAHIVGSPVERKVYKRLQQKGDMQNILLELFD